MVIHAATVESERRLLAWQRASPLFCCDILQHGIVEHRASPLAEASWTYSPGCTMMCSNSGFGAVSQENVMRKVLRGYAKGKDGDLIQIGTIPVPYAKDKTSPRERQDKRHLIRQGSTIFKKEIVR